MSALPVARCLTRRHAPLSTSTPACGCRVNDIRLESARMGCMSGPNRRNLCKCSMTKRHATVGASCGQSGPDPSHVLCSSPHASRRGADRRMRSARLGGQKCPQQGKHPNTDSSSCCMRLRNQPALADLKDVDRGARPHQLRSVGTSSKHRRSMLGVERDNVCASGSSVGK